MIGSEMLSFTTRYSGISRILSTEVEIAQAFNPRTAGPPTQYCHFRAIWDTGATNSVITPAIVSACGLQPIDISRIQTAGGVRLSRVYLVSLGLPNRILIPALRVTECEIGPDFDVLIGMDIIGRGDFAVSNFAEKTTFSFRVPSLAEVDYETEA